MSYPKRALLLAALLITMSADVVAETELTFDGQVRVRDELNKKSLYPDEVSDNYTYLRVRAGLKAVIDTNTVVYIQLQDSRTFGTGSSGNLNNGQNVDLHQGYLQINRFFADGFGMKAGRFEFTMGNQRVFGSVGWDNVGRSWEGSLYWYENQSVKILPFWLKQVERSDDLDAQILGLNLTGKKLGAELFVAYENDSYPVIISGRRYDRLRRVTFGGYLGRPLADRLDIVANAVYQSGSAAGPLYGPVRHYDIAAYLLTLEIGFSPDESPLRRVAVGIDYASGDDRGDSVKVKAYNNLYYTGHKFRGYMDYFISSNIEGLIDLYATATVVPVPKWTFKGTGHYFQTVEPYIFYRPVLYPSPASSRDVGIELDGSIATTSVAGVVLEAGASIFLVSDDWGQRIVGGDNGADNGWWTYAMATATF